MIRYVGKQEKEIKNRNTSNYTTVHISKRNENQYGKEKPELSCSLQYYSQHETT
jgi:hypothetical protein